MAIAQGARLLAERTAFRQATAENISNYRYKDMAFRIFRNDALQKYRAQFDMAARYVYLAAKAYALQLLVDLYRRGEIILDTVSELVEKQRGPVVGQPPHRCEVQFVTERVAGDIDQLRRRIREQYEGLQRSYAAAAQELEAIYRVVEHLRGMEDQIREEASSRVGRATAARTRSPR